MGIKLIKKEKKEKNKKIFKKFKKCVDKCRILIYTKFIKQIHIDKIYRKEKGPLGT